MNALSECPATVTRVGLPITAGAHYHVGDVAQVDVLTINNSMALGNTVEIATGNACSREAERYVEANVLF